MSRSRWRQYRCSPYSYSKFYVVLKLTKSKRQGIDTGRMILFLPVGDAAWKHSSVPLVCYSVWAQTGFLADSQFPHLSNENPIPPWVAERWKELNQIIHWKKQVPRTHLGPWWYRQVAELTHPQTVSSEDFWSLEIITPLSVIIIWSFTTSKMRLLILKKNLKFKWRGMNNGEKLKHCNHVWRRIELNKLWYIRRVEYYAVI
jgi:hypothetical protein